MQRFARILIVAAVVAGCGEGTGVQIPEGEAELRVVNASPDAATLQVMIGTRNFSTAAFPAATAYSDAPTGVRQLQVSSTVGGNPLLTATVGLQVDKRYTFLIMNWTDELQGLLLTDDPGTPQPGAALLRFVNTARTAGTLDLFLTASNANIQTATPSLTNLGFRQGSAYLNAAPGTYRLRGTVGGTRNVIVDIQEVTIAAGQTRTLVLVEAVDGGAPYSVLVLQD